MRNLFMLLGLIVITMLVTFSCGKKNTDSGPQSQGIVPANVFVQIPGTKVGK